MRLTLLIAFAVLLVPEPSAAESPVGYADGVRVRASPEASRGPQSVIGADERVRVTNTTGAPWRSIVYLEVYSASSGNQVAGICSGALVGPTVVLTAAHCLYGADGWIRRVAVVPGKNGLSEPYGYDFGAVWWVPPEYRLAGDPFFDYGLIALPSTELAFRVGSWFTVGVLSDASLGQGDFGPVVSGYPGSRATPSAGYGEHWAGLAANFTAISPTRLRYLVDTEPGESGAPIWRLRDGMVVGVHTHGFGTYNEGNRVDAFLKNDLEAVCAELGCTLSTYTEPTAVPTATPSAVATPLPPTPSVVPATPTPRPLTRSFLPLGSRLSGP